MAEAPRRPASVALACLFVGFSAALIVVNLVSALSDWGSIAMQDGLRDLLEAEPLASTNISMDQLLTYLRIAAQVVVVLAIAAGILAVYTARGHQPSRWVLIGLLGLTALTFVAGGLNGLLPALFAAMCISGLLSRDSRRWFAEKNGRTVPDPHQPAPTPSGAAPADPYAGSSGSPLQQAAVASPPHPHPGPDPAGQAHAPTPDARPRSVTVTTWITVVSSLVAVVGGVLTLALMTLGGDLVRESYEQPGLGRDLLQAADLTPDDMVAALQISAGLWIVLGVLGCAAALWARTGRRSGWVALLVMSIVTIAVSVLFIPFGLLTGAAAVVVIVQLNKAEWARWTARGAGT